MLYTKYHGSRPLGFRQKDFFHVFHIQAYVNHVNPGMGPFLVPGGLFEQTW